MLLYEKLKNKGILFWITVYLDLAKLLSQKYFTKDNSKFGPTIHLDGDQLRKSLKLYGYSYNDRLDNSKK